MQWLYGSLALLVLLIAAGYRPDLPLAALKQRYSRPNSSFREITVATLAGQDLSLSVHCCVDGAPGDPVVVLLHGAFASLHTFDPWAEQLVAAGYRVVRLDLPGFGLTGPWSDGVTSLRRSAAAVKAVLDSLQIPECWIGGNSLGGGVSWYFASEYHGVAGTRVRGLLLVDAIFPTPPGALAKRSHAPAARLFRLPLVRHLIPRLTPRVLVRRSLASAYGSRSQLSEAVVDRYADLLRRPGVRPAVAAARFEPDPPGVPTGQQRLDRIVSAGIPTLVQWGAEDRWINVSTADSFRGALALPNDAVLVYPWRGHVPMEEDPDGTGRDLLAFLDSHR